MFEVHLPPIYGEGVKNAMHRLLEEIDKRAHPSSHSVLSNERHNTVVMPRNDFFFGREDILHQLHQYVGPNEGKTTPRQKSCVLDGLGGSGKTQIALEYTYRYKKSYQYIFWLRSESAPELAENYGKIASVLKLIAPSASTDQKRNNEVVWKWLSECEKNWLLVFDNVVNVKSIRGYIPAGSRGSIIYTTQSSDLRNISGSNIQVSSFNSEEGASLLVRHLQDDNYEEEQPRMASELVGGLPLAIAHVAGYINSSQSTLQNFMDVFKDRRIGSRIWSGPPGASTFQYEKSLAIVFDIALDDLTPEAPELIECLAFLNPDSMPEAMLFHEEGKTSLVEPTMSGDFQKMELRKTLSARHLVERYAKPGYEPALSIHRSLKQALLYKLDQDPQKRQKRFNRAFELVRQVFPRQSPYRAPVNDLWPVYERYLPQVLSLHTSYVTSETPLAPSLPFAELLSDAGNYLWERSLTKDAFTILATATEICDEVLEIDDPNPVRTSILAVVASFEPNQSARMRAPGLAHKIRILSLRRKYMASKPVHELTKFDGLLLGSALNNLAGAYMNCDDWQNAETVLLESLEVKNRWSTEQDTPFPFAEAYKNIALVRLSQHKVEDALKLIELAVEMMLAWKGPRTKASQYFRFVWAFMLENCGRQEEALAMHMEVLAMRKEVIGEGSAQTLDSCYSIGAIHCSRNELDEAERYLRASLQSREEWYGPNIARAMFKLSQVFEKQKKYDDARRWYQDARKLRDTLVSPEYPCPGVNLDEEDEMLIYDQLVQIWSGRTSGTLNVEDHIKNQQDGSDSVDSMTRPGGAHNSWWCLLCFWP
ncbi:hypothetical protein BKA64DRAFT_570324 [Cadophora sp. MPI-SDFR-AT-0126]|nr:hypothetical protein BKA64DRAFT_570324 [Leotiomycetes sp. MPI-SDFR-AT-0126]